MSLRDAWEAEAGNWIAWARTPGHDSYWLFHGDAFLPSLPPAPCRVIDVGCGEGRLPRDLKRLGYEIVGVDGSPTLLAVAREADPAGRWHGVHVTAGRPRHRRGAPGDRPRPDAAATCSRAMA